MNRRGLTDDFVRNVYAPNEEAEKVVTPDTSDPMTHVVPSAEPERLFLGGTLLPLSKSSAFRLITVVKLGSPNKADRSVKMGETG